MINARYKQYVLAWRGASSVSQRYHLSFGSSLTLVGDVDKVRHGLASLLRETQADEIMVNGQIYDTDARLHSFKLAMEAARGL